VREEAVDNSLPSRLPFWTMHAYGAPTDTLTHASFPSGLVGPPTLPPTLPPSLPPYLRPVPFLLHAQTSRETQVAHFEVAIAVQEQVRGLLGGTEGGRKGGREGGRGKGRAQAQ
jgi:hypothetical protein